MNGSAITLGAPIPDRCRAELRFPIGHPATVASRGAAVGSCPWAIGDGLHHKNEPRWRRLRRQGDRCCSAIPSGMSCSRQRQVTRPNTVGSWGRRAGIRLTGSAPGSGAQSDVIGSPRHVLPLDIGGSSPRAERSTAIGAYSSAALVGLSACDIDVAGGALRQIRPRNHSRRLICDEGRAGGRRCC